MPGNSRLHLREALDRYRIERHVVDEAADRALWQATAAEDVVGDREERTSGGGTAPLDWRRSDRGCER
jgi:hypothetical protein